MAFTFVILTTTSVGKGPSTFDLCVRDSCHRNLRGKEHCLIVTSCCRPCIWWYLSTISKMSLKNCKGETINVLSYLRLPRLKRRVWRLLLPVFLTKGWGLGYFWDVCCLLQILQLSATLKSTVHWRETVPKNNCPGWRVSQVDQRIFLNPCHLPFPLPHALLQPF